MTHALLIDGENRSSRHGPTLLQQVPADCAVRRVYGDVARLNGWLSVAGLDPIHVTAGRNAADIALAVGAMSLLATGTRSFAIATSDSGLTSLIVALREHGARVVVMGEEKAAPALRTAGHAFTLLTLPAAAASVPAPVQAPQIPAATLPVPPASVPAVPPAGPAAKKVAAFVRDLLAAAPGHALPLTAIDPQVRKNLGITVSTLPGTTWRAFLSAHPDQFSLDPRGPEARVRLR